MYDCDDIRFCLAVARTGTLSGAAVNLGVNHSNVWPYQPAGRTGWSTPLRVPSRRVALTPTGKIMRGSAERTEEELQAFDRRVTKPFNKIEN